MEKTICREERRIFLSEWLKKPTQLGTLAPVTVRFADALASLIPEPQTAKVVEIGAGTGRITRALLRAGVKPHNLVAVELNECLCDFLRQCWSSQPDQSPIVVQGNAIDLPRIIPQEFMGSTTTVVSAIPFRYISPFVRTQIVEASHNILAPGGTMLHVTYHPSSPIMHMSNIASKRRISLWLNLPPAFVFEFTSVTSQP